MLFHSIEFLFVFLPLTWIGFLVFIKGRMIQGALAWLSLASLVFYAWWNPAYLVLMVASILANFFLGRALSAGGSKRWRGFILILGLVLNLGALGYFKYANFFVDNLNLILGTQYNLERIVLPLAISFFTFQQVAYLIDGWRGGSPRYSFLEYCFFVAFFPQLMAGPIVHHRQVLRQVERERWRPHRMMNLRVGLTIFALGLFKKMFIADGCGEYATPMFNAATEGVVFSTIDTWIAVIAYSSQLYFDFSGYSDMAIGLSRCFGIVLPLNFDSPYKAKNIIEFWRKWHITLSQFLRDYVYIPLGGNRRGVAIRYSNIMITMMIGGLWHGAGWNFLIWGGLHGIYLGINHAFNSLRWFRFRQGGLAARSAEFGGWVLTALAVLVGWVFFRAADLDTALGMLEVMFGLGLPESEVLPPAIDALLGGSDKYLWLLAVNCVVFFAPSTHQFMGNYRPAFGFLRKDRVMRGPAWRPTIAYGLFMGGIVFFIFRQYLKLAPTEFLYFNF